VGSWCGSGGDDEAKPPGKYAAKAAVLTLLGGIQSYPDGVNAVEILGTYRPANRIDAGRDQGRVVERERELRGTGSLSVPDAGGAE
jgi:hypothetical protein